MLPYIIVGLLVPGGITSLVEAWRNPDGNSDGDAFDDYDEFCHTNGDEEDVE